MKPELSASFRVELVISNLLRWGVVFSLLLLGIGTALCFLTPGDYGCGGGTATDLHRLLTTPATPSFTLHTWLIALGQMQGSALVLTGLILLILTPVLRVITSIVAFALEKDRAYVVITSIVLLLLLLSFALGKAG